MSRTRAYLVSRLKSLTCVNMKHPFIESVKLMRWRELQCFYDNIVFAPFIFIEDPVDVNGQRSNSQEATGPPAFTPVAGLGGPGGLSPAPGVGGSSMFGQLKIDPYYLITRVCLRAKSSSRSKLIGPWHLPRNCSSHFVPRWKVRSPRTIHISTQGQLELGTRGACSWLLPRRSLCKCSTRRAVDVEEACLLADW